MDVGAFGSTCSPCQAQHIKNMNAEEHRKTFPRAASAIVLKHYGDDYLDSFDSEEEAIEVALEVKQVQRVLGMSRVPSDNQFMLVVDNPLGLMPHFLIHGRVIIQNVWRTHTGWEEVVSAEIHAKWQPWVAKFEELSKIRIYNSVTDIGELQLHIFTDASEDAYAAVAYLRADINIQIYCALVLDKTKVVPLKLYLFHGWNSKALCWVPECCGPLSNPIQCPLFDE